MQYKAPEYFADDDSDDDDDDDNSDNETKASPKVTYQPSADVYSFGVVCWEILTGKVPFADKTAGNIVAAHIRALNGGKIKRPSLKGVPSEMIPFIKACWAQDPSARPTFRVAKDMLDALPILAVPDALNAPGYWDVIILHSRRCAAAVTLATETATWFEKKGLSVWLDVRMTERGEAAMEEGVKNSKYFIAVVTGQCVNNDRPNDDPVGNAYFRRPYCIKELRWAQVFFASREQRQDERYRLLHQGPFRWAVRRRHHAGCKKVVNEPGHHQRQENQRVRPVSG